jgi:hypothetical protein
MVTSKRSMSTEGERHSKFLSYLTDVRYVHPRWHGKCQFLANSKTQNVFLFPVHAMVRHDCPLPVKPSSTPRRLVHKKKLGEIPYLLICSFLLCLSWLLCSRVQKFRRDLWITLYNGYWVFPGGEERPGRAADHSPPSSAEVLEE